MKRGDEIQQAGNAVQQAIRTGLLIKPERCSQCGKKVLEVRQLHAHHANYARPLDVEWLCNRCHVKRHKILRWFSMCFAFWEFCSKNKINPADKDLPAHHKITGKPLKKTIFEAWLERKSQR